MYTSGTSGRGSIFITILGRDIRAEVKRRCASADYTDAGGVPHPPGRERIGSIVSSADPPHGNAGNVGTGIVSPIDACVSVGVRPTRHTGNCGAAPRVPTRLRARGITPHALGIVPCRVRRARCHPVHRPAPTSAPSAHLSAHPCCCVHATVPTGHAVPTFACMHGSQRAMPHACDGPNGPSSPVSSRRRRHTVHVDDGCHRERRERERGEWPVPAETDGQRAESEP